MASKSDSFNIEWKTTTTCIDTPAPNQFLTVTPDCFDSNPAPPEFASDEELDPEEVARIRREIEKKAKQQRGKKKNSININTIFVTFDRKNQGGRPKNH